MLTVGDRSADEEVTGIEIHRDDPGGTPIAKVAERGLLHGTPSRRHEDVMLVIKRFDRQDHGNLFAIHQGKAIDDRASARCARTLRHLVDLHPVNPAPIRETQQRVVSVGNEELIHPIILTRGCSLTATATPTLGTIFGERLALHIPAMGNRHHHIGRRDEIFHPKLRGIGLDAGAARITKLASYFLEFVGDDRGDPFSPRQNVEQISDRQYDLAVFRDNAILLKPGQALEPHVQNFLSLCFRKPVALRTEAQRGIHALGAECAQARQRL